jgi:hypothetical protein
MKASSLILSLIILGSSSPGLNFHVFMEPLYDELFKVGMLTYDASRDVSTSCICVIHYK